MAELVAPELLLVSGSSGLADRYVNNEKRVSFDLVFDLSKKYRLHSPSLVEVWRNDISTPLRDRLMIEWVFFHSEDVKQLTLMIEEITELITLKIGNVSAVKGSEHSSTLFVAVTCSTGHQLSPCFVEKLYDHFSSTVSNVSVKRHHHTISLKMTHCKQNLWQYKHFKLKQREFSSVHQLTGTICTSLRWYDFPNATNMKLETLFRENPFSTSCVIDDLEVDFQDGTSRRITTNQFSFVRCIPRGSMKRYTVVARSINHEQYKSYVKSRTYQAAGILPYAVHPVSGEAVFLLGKITYGTMTWCDFGGLKSHFPLLHMFQRERLSLRESPAETAARECCEETMGMFGDTATLLANIRDYKTNNVFKVINEEHNYVGHFLRVAYDSYPDQYVAILQRCSSSSRSGEIEVEMMRWVGMSALHMAVEEKLAGIENTSVPPINEKDGGSDSSVDLYLRQEFVESLCVAEKLGVLKSIAAIARKMHKATKKNESDLLTECQDLEQGEEDEEEDCDEENESERLDIATEQDLASSSGATDSSHCQTNASFPLTSAPATSTGGDELSAASAQQSNPQQEENCDEERMKHRRRRRRRKKGGVDITMYGMGSGSVMMEL